MTIRPEILQNLFVVGLRNAHAVEKQALSIMTPQVERIVNYPEVADRLRLHIDETHAQIARIDEILASLDMLPGIHAIGRLARQMETSDAARPFYRGSDHRRAA